MSGSVLNVDDDEDTRTLLCQALRRRGFAVEGANTARACLEHLRTNTVDVVVTDVQMPGISGVELCRVLRERHPDLLPIVLTGAGNLEVAISAIQAGAYDFLTKPFVSTEAVVHSLEKAAEHRRLLDRTRLLEQRLEQHERFGELVGSSPRMQEVYRLALGVAPTTSTVLILGENGTGKELVARAIHQHSSRSDKPVRAVNCGAIPENLVESILFGHEKGSFTGATEKHTGKFIEASGGTLFLDEVGELPMAAQVKLLRAIQEGEVEPVGGRKPVKVDVRIVSATNRNLIDDVKSGRFREDLFYRLHVFPIAVPPLRERAEDIPDLVRHFLARIAAEEGKRVRTISGEALTLLSRHRWPGNVRQLENAVFRAVVMAEGDSIGVGEFPQIAAQMQGSTIPEMHSEALPSMLDVPSLHDNGHGGNGMSGSMSGAAPANPYIHGAIEVLNAHGDVRPLEDIESEVIRFAIAHYRGQMSEVARRLQIGRSTLYRKLENLGLAERSHEERKETAKEPAGAH